MTERDIERALHVHLDKVQLRIETRAAIRAAAGAKRVEARRLSLGLVLAIVLVLVTMAAAIAAAQLGWVDFFGANYHVDVPTAAQEALEATKPQTFQVGPMTFTYKQLLTDRHIALSCAEVYMTDGTEVLYADDGNFYEAVDAVSDTVRKKYDLPPGATWVDAAKQLNMPLYGIRALIEVAPEYSRSEAMEDALWNEDGSIVYYNMPLLAPGTVQNELPATLYMAVHRYDPAAGKVSVNQWTAREAIMLPVAPLLAEKTYLPQGDDELAAGMKLTEVHAEQYATGIYLTCKMAVPDDMTQEAACDILDGLHICDGDGNALPGGMNLSGGIVTDRLLTVEWESMTSMDKMPDVLILRCGASGITVK